MSYQDEIRAIRQRVEWVTEQTEANTVETSSAPVEEQLSAIWSALETLAIGLDSAPRAAKDESDQSLRRALDQFGI